VLICWFVDKDIVSSVVFDAKKLDESTVAAESRDVDFKKAETEEVAESHSKDATVTSNVSDITTVVATNVRPGDAGYMLCITDTNIHSYLGD
jgi:hypothetical protein